MALMEADGKDFDSAKNALGAMLNRAHRDKVDLGEHVSARIYQPTIEPAQFARLPSILSSAEHKRLAELARRRMSGQEPDWVRGATHFLAPEKTMLGLSAREPQKYRSWPQWTGFNPQSGQYSNVVLRDRSHAFLAPEGRYSADYGYQQPPDGMDTATYGAPEPSASPRMALGGPKPGSGPMATYTPVNGQSPSPFTGMTPEEVELYRRQGLRNTQLANDASPVGHWTQALARVVQGGLGGYQLSQAARGERAGQQAASQALISALSGGDPKLAIAGMAGHPWARPLAEKLASGVLQGELEARSPMGKLKHRALELDVQGKEELAPVEREARKEEIEAKRSQRQMDQWILGQMQGEAPAAATPASPAHAGALPLSPVPGISVAPPTGAAPAPVPASTPTPANRVQSLREVLASRSPADRMAFLMAYRKDPGKAAEMLAGWADPDKKLKEAADKERGEQIGKAQAALPKVIKDTDAVLKQIDDLLYVADPKNPGKYLPDPKDPSKLRSNPELSKGLGWFAGNAPDWMKGSDIHDVQEKLKQVGGGAFLQAYESLRGAGSITEKEAEPATTALARLRNLRQSDPGYRAALRDFRDRVVDLRKLAHDRASGKVPMPTETPVRTPQPGGAAPASGGDPLTEARAAIAKGAPRDKVIERLRERGIDPAGL